MAAYFDYLFVVLLEIRQLVETKSQRQKSAFEGIGP